MYSWGYKIKDHEYENFRAYLEAMLRMNRIMVIWDRGRIICLIVYFLTKDFVNSYKKGTWDIPEDNPLGHQIYIDKMICSKWTVSIRKALQKSIEEKFPFVTEGYYHREPFDRLIKIYRRNYVQSTVLG
jgi:hypothetical protein